MLYYVYYAPRFRHAADTLRSIFTIDFAYDAMLYDDFAAYSMPRMRAAAVTPIYKRRHARYTRYAGITP